MAWTFENSKPTPSDLSPLTSPHVQIPPNFNWEPSIQIEEPVKPFSFELPQRYEGGNRLIEGSDRIGRKKTKNKNKEANKRQKKNLGK